LYLHHLPGRNESLADFFKEVRERRIDRIISLAQPDEIARKAPEYARAITEGTLPCDRIAYPIPDYGTPENPEAFLRLAREIAKEIRAGKRILIHCGAGIGRTGTLACCVLTAMGLDAEKATRIIEASGSHPETREQIEIVERSVQAATAAVL